MNTRDCIGHVVSTTCEDDTCAGDTGICVANQKNTQIGGVYRVRNARWPDWYMYIRSSSREPRVYEGRSNAGGAVSQFTLLKPPSPPSTQQTGLYFLFTEWLRDATLTVTSRRVCSVVINGTELELENKTAPPDETLEPGPDGFEEEGHDLNGVPLEPVSQNETAKQLEIAGREEGDEDSDTLEWFEELDGGDDDELAPQGQRQGGTAELSYRSRYSSTYYSRSRYYSYYSRSRSFYYSDRRRFGRSRSFYSSYYYHDRRRVYCRDVAVSTVLEVDSTPTPSVNKLALKLEHAPVKSDNPQMQLLMFGPPSYPGSYLYVGRYSSSVDVYRGDPGAGGYWFFDPPLPSSVGSNIAQYSGSRCSWWCGSVGKASDIGVTFISAARLCCSPTGVVAMLAHATVAIANIAS